MTDEQENNLCLICGGTIAIDWTITFREGHPHTMKVSSLERICFGHPIPEQVYKSEITAQEWDVIMQTPRIRNRLRELAQQALREGTDEIQA